MTPCQGGLFLGVLSEHGFQHAVDFWTGAHYEIVYAAVFPDHHDVGVLAIGEVVELSGFPFRKLIRKSYCHMQTEAHKSLWQRA